MLEKGQPAFVPPYTANIDLPDAKGVLRPNQPTMFVLAPIRDDSGQPIAVLGFRMHPEQAFAPPLLAGRSGLTGETYAFDKTGRMVSDSRFNDDLQRIGLIPDTEDSQAILQVEVRDPGGNLLDGFQPKLPRDRQPLTLMAAAATQSKAGINIDGYRDYRGVPVVGAWVWLPELDLGLAREIDVHEAYATVYQVRNQFVPLLRCSCARRWRLSCCMGCGCGRIASEPGPRPK